MTLRINEPLQKPCLKCKRNFVHNSPTNKLCPKCRGGAEWLRNLAVRQGKENQNLKEHKRIIKQNKLEKQAER